MKAVSFCICSENSLIFGALDSFVSACKGKTRKKEHNVRIFNRKSALKIRDSERITEVNMNLIG